MPEYQIKEAFNVGDSVRYHAERTPNKVATVFEDRSTTFAQVDRYSNQIANGLAKLGVKQQERVGYYGKNSDYHPQLMAGVNKANAVLVPVNWRLAPPEVRYVMDNADIKVLVVGSEFAGLVESLIDELPTLETVLVIDGPYKNWGDFAQWRDAQDPTDPKIPVGPRDVYVQLYTSGTTGKPKGVMIPNNAAYLGWEGHPPDPEPLKGTYKEYSPDEVALCIAPNFHLSGNGSVLTGLRMGTTVVIHPDFDVTRMVDAVLEYKVAKIFMVPAVLKILLDKAKQGADLSSIRLISYGASPIPPELMREAVEIIGCGFLQMYGMTEIGGSATFLEPADHTLVPTEKMKSCGRPGELHEMKIVDPVTRKELPPRTPGEVALRTAAPMVGYYKNPEATAQVLDADGWYYSGDVGYMDEENYVYIQDRLKDMIVTGGENVYSAEVESALYEHPAVKEAAVIGVPSERWGEEVKAIVVLEPGKELTADELIMFARQHIAGYKVPKSVEFIAELPRNGTGKLMKHVLREPYWAGRERQVS
ncbi:long-chain-fatty-acid--CoA ligase [Iodidimonas sp. SYSU 1G8]|uniref:long-chain-fatty-acid--CoA ligase n=1 Tax=Iodidimonas sp. SYSU 1G8 TaxID=3133967 RepID=UPI0031FEA39C